jgi:hypothetical protein
MSDTPDWLPALVLFSDYGGEWDRYLEALYHHFHNDFIASKPMYSGKRWALKRYPLIKGKESTFWHLISEGDSEGDIEAERLPDLRRCERICWPRRLIDEVASGRVRVWRTLRREEERVVLADRGDYIMLWTAYYVEMEHRRKKLKREL